MKVEELNIEQPQKALLWDFIKILNNLNQVVIMVNNEVNGC